MQGNRKTFVLGVGCHKGGTSWIARHLSTHPGCATPLVKEMHVFDSAFIPEDYGSWDKTVIKQISLLTLRDILRQAKKLEYLACKESLQNCIDLVRMRSSLDYYTVYYRRISKDPKISITYDITPSYCALEAAHYRDIKKRIEAAGFDLKIIFLMRDPAERIYSSVRMNARRCSHKYKMAALTELQQHQRVKNVYKSKGNEVRTRYENTIRNLEDVFPSSQIYYGFYETMFNKENLHALDEFLGVSLPHQNVEVKVNVSPKTGELPPEIVCNIREYYAETYRFCAAKFGQQRIAEIWPSYMLT